MIAFWHIPWPKPEAFGICPWHEEILAGMLGSSILGFHTQSHCNNFLDTVDRFLEARVDRETFTIWFGGEPTVVHRYPISIEWPPHGAALDVPIGTCRREVRERLGLAQDVRIVLGVDRLDYTKGIVERFLALERLLESEPAWVGRVVFLQVAAPSRSRIEEYHAFEAQVLALAERINARFRRPGYEPIVLKVEHHEFAQVPFLYRAADVCMVTSLHDGMNLVSKEFVAARDDEAGVLIVSQFAGASRGTPRDIRASDDERHPHRTDGIHGANVRRLSGRVRIRERWQELGARNVDAGNLHVRLRQVRQAKVFGRNDRVPDSPLLVSRFKGRATRRG